MTTTVVDRKHHDASCHSFENKKLLMKNR